MRDYLATEKIKMQKTQLTRVENRSRRALETTRLYLTSYQV